MWTECVVGPGGGCEGGGCAVKAGVESVKEPSSGLWQDSASGKSEKKVNLK